MKSLLKKLYSILPFKQEAFTVLKQVWKPSSSVYRHLHFKGIITVSVDEQTKFKMKHYGFQLENEVFWAGIRNGWEKQSTRLWIRLCSQSTVILDIGANTGIYSLIAKAVNPTSVVYAFEPVERVFSKLEENIRLNNFDVHTIKKAVSEKDGSAVIYDMPVEHVYSVTVNKNLATPDTKVIKTEIQTLSLDSFTEKNHLQRIDLIKLDVETHEPEVLRGFSKYLKQFRPVMLIEILNDEVGKQVEELVEDIPYLFFNIDEKGGIRKTEKIVKSDYYNYLLCESSTAVSLGLPIS